MTLSRTGRRCLSVALLTIGAGAGQGLAGAGALAAPAARTMHSQVPALTTLGGDVIPHLAGYRDLGPTPADQVFQVAVVMQHDQAAVNRALAALYDPASPSYHRWMTPSQFQARFGASPQNVALVRQFATARGMQLYNADGLGDLTLVSGTTAQVEATFHVTMHRFQAPDGRSFYANLQGPTVPGGVGVAGVLGLQDLLQFQLAPMGSGGSSAGSSSATPSSQGQCVANPAGGNVCTGLLGPQDLWSVYDQPAADQGQGQSVGIIGEGRTDDVVNALREFEKTRGLPNVPVQTYWTDGGAKTDDGGRVEWELDSQAITGMAPQLSQLRLYFGSSLALSSLASSLQTWANDPDGPQQVNASIGICEDFPGIDALFGPSQTADSFALAQAATEGRTFFASAGDTGSGCLVLFNPPVTPPAWPPPINGIWYGELPWASYPAADPNATSVGGTVVYTDGNGTLVNEHAWDHTGGTRSSFIPEPSYQTAVPQLAANLCLSQANGQPYVPPVACRGTADVSALSGDGTIILNHEGNTNAHQGPLPGPNPYPLGNNAIQANGYSIVDDAMPPDGPDAFNDNFSEGGTSLASPLWAGMWARVAAAHDGNIGRANDQIYKVASGPEYAQDFNDVVTGANPLPTTPGWDFPTGWGSPKLTGLIKDVDGGNLTPVNDVAPSSGPDPSPIQASGPDYGCPATVAGAPSSAVALPSSQPQLTFTHGDLALSDDGTALRAALTVQNLSQSLPTGFTSEDWILSWAKPVPQAATSSDSFYYAAAATVDAVNGLTFSDGILDVTSSGYTYTPSNTITGKFTDGPNGVVEIDVPLTHIGSPAVGSDMGIVSAATDEGNPVTGLIVEQAAGSRGYTLGDPSCLTSPAVVVPETPVATALPLAGGGVVALVGAVGLRRRRRRRGAAAE